MSEHQQRQREAAKEYLERVAKDYAEFDQQVLPNIPGLNEGVVILKAKLDDEDLKMLQRVIVLAMQYGRKIEKGEPKIILPNKDIIH